MNPQLTQGVDSTQPGYVADTRAQAHADIKPKKPSIRSRVLQQVEDAGLMYGITGGEIAVNLGEFEITVKARLTELLQSGQVRVSGSRRNSRGKQENVYTLGDGIVRNAPVIKPNVDTYVRVLRAAGVTADYILDSNNLNWADTPEGSKFWDRVYVQLEYKPNGQ